MKLKILLYVLKRKLMKNLKNNSDFQEKVKEKDFTMQIRTKDKKTGRSFTFNQGTITSKGGVSDSCDVEMVWEDANTAYQVMSSAKQEEFMKAIQSKQAVIEGKVELMLWFMEALKKMKA